ncbi:nucleoside-diphosphate kinase [bacterium]|nr:nucleoside-diphosphate kinase [bacterium]
MSAQLAYALITPYSLIKSRTGGIISRLLQARLELVGARMLAPTDAFVDAYKHLFLRDDITEPAKSALMDYCDANLRPNNRFGISNRCMLLLFAGENATTHLKEEVVGSFDATPRGDTVRGTYGDFVLETNGSVHYAEPAAIVSPSKDVTADHLRVLSEFVDSDGGLVEKAADGLFKPDETPETTLVILKPDNFGPGKVLPGNIVDMFAKTGLYMVGAKVLHLTVDQGEDFYGHLRPSFRERMLGGLTEDVASTFGGAFKFPVPDGVVEQTAASLIGAKADFEVDQIVEYMTGRNPSRLASEEERSLPGAAMCLALLYKGVNAIAKIRERLGATNPDKAEPGSIRDVFGFDIMHNAAHASDSVGSAERERKIVGLWDDPAPCDIKQIIDAHLASL